MADDKQVHIDTEDARAGWTPHVTRYVLGISLAAVVILFAIIVLL
ncbi:hypothetical protein [Sphingomonas cavernae]|nr:hypothetical protein [Sphingomonas cavernae]